MVFGKDAAVSAGRLEVSKIAGSHLSRDRREARVLLQSTWGAIIAIAGCIQGHGIPVQGAEEHRIVEWFTLLA